MQSVTIEKNQAGQRLDKFLRKFMPAAGTGFLYKMLRKKNITLNGKRAEGGEILFVGDSLSFFFSQETFAKMTGCNTWEAPPSREHAKDREAGRAPAAEYIRAYHTLSDSEISVLYEDDDILLADKPAGILSQKASASDISLNEWLIGYLLEKDGISPEELRTFKPSVCNRLDRNTSGIVLCAKSVQGAQLFSSLLQNRTLHKYYQLYVKGTLQDSQLIEGYLTKDSRHNRVSIQPHSRANDSSLTKESYIRTHYRPLKAETDKTLVEVELLTGKPHQIRAHLAGIGHPLLGDYKYGDKNWNDYYKKTCQIRSQLLHACRVTFPELGPPFDDISGRTFQSGLPETFDRVSAQAARI